MITSTRHTETEATFTIQLTDAQVRDFREWAEFHDLQEVDFADETRPPMAGIFAILPGFRFLNPVNQQTYVMAPTRAILTIPLNDDREVPIVMTWG